MYSNFSINLFTAEDQLKMIDPLVSAVGVSKYNAKLTEYLLIQEVPKVPKSSTNPLQCNSSNL